MIPTPLGINSTRMESQGQPPHHYDDVPHDIDHENDLDDDDDDVENEEAQLPHALIDLDLVCLGDFQKKLQEDSSDGTKAINATSRVKLRADIARDKSQGCLYGAGDMSSQTIAPEWVARQISQANERFEQQMKEQQEQHQKIQEEMLNTIREIKASVSELSQHLQSCCRRHPDCEEYSHHDDQYNPT
ncbi:hypothetical protein JHK85_025510 [Glycine max]|nr:hypothetical protein JHK85_025510 [Glycine max]